MQQIKPLPVGDVQDVAESADLLIDAEREAVARTVPAPSQAEVTVSLVLFVKFLDEARVRAHGKEVDAVGACKEKIAQALSKFSEQHVEMHSVFEGVGSELDALVAQAEEAVGEHEPDLRGITRIDVQGGDIAITVAVGQVLEGTGCVEYASVQWGMPPPPCYGGWCTEDGQPVCEGDTPDFEYLQTYRGPDPGIEADWALSEGADGEGVRYADVEYAMNFDHEDLPLVPSPSGEPSPDILAIYGDNHGTASVSIAVGKENGYGVLGLAPKAEAAFFPEWVKGGVWDRVSAMGHAFAHSRPGDVILMEMQLVGWHEPSMPPDKQILLTPAEADPAMWQVVKVAVDAGVVVVAGAGNGYPDTGYRESYSLDGDLYGLPTWRARGDSGAIIVGAGSSHVEHQKLPYSGYGSRVNVQAWGQGVAAAGNSDSCGYIGSQNREYCKGFSGTSSASAIVGAAAAQLQSLAKKEGKMLTSRQMRELLVSTGTPQGGVNVSEQIGPHINLRAAIEKFRSSMPTTSTSSKATTTATTTTRTTTTDDERGECSEVGDNCHDTKCCTLDNHRCYEKNERWAGCKVSCFPGIDEHDPEEHQTPWTCRPLGGCSDSGEDCRETKCCSDISQTCFLKDDRWAACRDTCVPGIQDDDHKDHLTPWSCDILGTSAPQHLLGRHRRYLTAELDGAVAGNREAADTWQAWEIVKNEDGTVSLRSYWGLWLAAQPSGEVKAESGHLNDWEKFRLTRYDDGRVSFRSFHGQYLCMEQHGDVKADRDVPDDSEKFTLGPARFHAAEDIDQLDGTLPRSAHRLLDQQPLPHLALAAAGTLLTALAVTSRRSLRALSTALATSTRRSLRAVTREENTVLIDASFEL